MAAPSDDSDVTAVGGTTLAIGAHDQRVFETGWSTLFGERTGTSGPWHDEGAHQGAGGGASVIYGEPSYQNGVVPSALAENGEGRAGRAVPDISADADFYSGMLTRWVFTNSHGKTFRSWRSQGGTSLATPLVAGMVADAEQGHRRNLGFLNRCSTRSPEARVGEVVVVDDGALSAWHDLLLTGATVTI